MRRVLVALFQNIIMILPPKVALLVEYVVRCRRLPRIRRPRTFTEKVLWRKLYDARPEIVIGCNKIRAKQWATERLAGSGVRTAETIWSGNYLDARAAVRADVDPTVGSWVLKPVALGGGIVMFGSGNAIDEDEYRTFAKKFNTGRKIFAKIGGRAWGDGQGIAMIERRIGSGEESLADFKVHVFNGRAVYIVVYVNRFDGVSTRRYDLRSDVQRLAADCEISRDVVDQLTRAAETLAAAMDYMRVDFYVVDSQVYFGELTPYPSFAEADASKTFDRSLGELWHIEARGGG